MEDELRAALAEALDQWEGWAAERSPSVVIPRIAELRAKFLGEPQHWRCPGCGTTTWTPAKTEPHGCDQCGRFMQRIAIMPSPASDPASSR